jgi:hypothetical protein
MPERAQPGVAASHVAQDKQSSPYCAASAPGVPHFRSGQRKLEVAKKKVAIPGSGGREDRTMPGDYDWKERRDQVERYRILAQEITDPIAARLLNDIVLDLKAELKGSSQSCGLDAA